MIMRNVICPICGQAQTVEKVSTIYVLGIDPARLEKLAPAVQEAAGGKAGRSKIPAAELKLLSQRLMPPAMGRESPTNRPISPDMAVAVFSLVIPFLLFKINTSQPAALPVALVCLAVFYGAYFLMRKSLKARFERGLAEQKAKVERVKRGIGRWMKLYYCTQDDVVFEPGAERTVPADQMGGYLLEE